MNVLVTGGAGYIGSQAVRNLIFAGHKVVVLDDLSTGHRAAVPANVEFIRASIDNADLLKSLFRLHKITAVLHFAGLIDVGESVHDPLKYYAGNFSNSLVLLKTMVECQVQRLIFSSSAAVYGQTAQLLVSEDHPRVPINPYGRSKLLTEMAIEDFHASYGLDFTILRCFNVVGASIDGQHGEAHQPESHLVPRVLQNLLQGHRGLTIHGTDYPTMDGTCVRDYTHVVDVARAHVLALENLRPGTHAIYNLGREKGISVREVIDQCEKVSGRRLRVEAGCRREGDPAILVANSQKIRSELGYQPQFPNLQDAIQHAWVWHSQRPHGYRTETAATSLTMDSATRMPSQAALVMPPA
jgi:UDP-glucose 4-epimerase